MAIRIKKLNDLNLLTIFFFFQASPVASPRSSPRSSTTSSPAPAAKRQKLSHEDWVEVPPNDDFISPTSPITAPSPDLAKSQDIKDLGDPTKIPSTDLTTETHPAAQKSTSLRSPIVLSSDDDDDGLDDFELFPKSSKGIAAKMGSRNEIFGYRFASRYLMAAFLGKNGHGSNEKVYDKEFVAAVTASIEERNKKGDVQDNTLLCNMLRIHSVKPMREKGSDGPKRYPYKNGGIGYYNVYVRVLSKAEVRANLDTDLELWNWLEDIRKCFNSTPTTSQYSLPYLSNGGVLGRTRSRERTLDEVLLDGDVADYAKMVYAKYYKDGTLIQRRSKVLKFFSAGNTAANDLLG